MTTPADRARRQVYTDEGTWTGARVKAAIRTAYRAAYRVPAEHRTLDHTDIMNWPVYHLPPFWHQERRACQMMGLAATKLYALSDLLQRLINEKTGKAVKRSTYEVWVRHGVDGIAEHLNAPAVAASRRAEEPVALRLAA